MVNVKIKNNNKVKINEVLVYPPKIKNKKMVLDQKRWQNNSVFEWVIIKFLVKIFSFKVFGVEALRHDDPCNCQMDARFQPR